MAKAQINFLTTFLPQNSNSDGDPNNIDWKPLDRGP